MLRMQINQNELRWKSKKGIKSLLVGDFVDMEVEVEDLGQGAQIFTNKKIPPY